MMRPPFPSRRGYRPPRALAVATLALGAVLAIATRSVAAQAQDAGASRTTSAGIYTLDQATRGRDTFAASCLGCHTVASHTGDVFRATWNGRPLSDLFGYISNRMPKSEPGSLTPDEYAQVVAYVLKLNGVPAGDQELQADPPLLKRIRIEIPKDP